jgi:hypothetical protein
MVSGAWLYGGSDRRYHRRNSIIIGQLSTVEYWKVIRSAFISLETEFLTKTYGKADQIGMRKAIPYLNLYATVSRTSLNSLVTINI